MAPGNTAHLRRRHRAEQRFRWYGRIAIGVALAILALLLGAIIVQGTGAFHAAAMDVRITFPDDFDPATADKGVYQEILRAGLRAQLPGLDVSSRPQRKEAHELLSLGATYELMQVVRRGEVEARPGREEYVRVTASDDADMYLKGRIRRDASGAGGGRLSARQMDWLDGLQAQGALKQHWTPYFFTAADSREPELAGMLGSILGSLFVLAVCAAVAFPLGVATAVWLQEFAPKNRWSDFIEVNINNLAAVPSIIFGLLGLAVYLQFAGLPRSSALAGGLTLALMILPNIIIATRAALRAVPDSIREAARGLGASPVQVVWHHSLPLAMPGIMTGAILGIARAIGETAPLMMIGMVAFVADVPGGILDPATAMPVQIFIWSDSPELAFGEKTSAAIMILLAFLLVINATAIYIRRRYEKVW